MPSIFSGRAVASGHPAQPTTQPTSSRRLIELPFFSAVDYETCDPGYALAADSCERVVSVDACTVAASDAVTAFAVPDLGGHLAVPSIFSGLAVARVAPRNRPLSLLQAGVLLSCRSFRPSTKAILTEDGEMSTPKVCAPATFLRSMSS